MLFFRKCCFVVILIYLLFVVWDRVWVFEVFVWFVVLDVMFGLVVDWVVGVVWKCVLNSLFKNNIFIRYFYIFNRFWEKIKYNIEILL